MSAQIRLGGWLLGAVVVSTLLRLFVGAGTELFPAEAFYWTNSVSPAWGYQGHPPLVAWLARAGTFWLGHTELGVRLGSVLLWVGTVAAVWGATRLWFGVLAAHWAGLLLVVLPLGGVVGLLLLPEGPLMFCWALGLLLVSLAVHRHGAWWLGVGLAYGGALLAQSTAAVLGGSLLLFLLLAPAYRGWLWRAGPWLAVAIGWAMFSPVLGWHAGRGWSGLEVALAEAPGAVVRSGLAQVGVFWGLQLLLLTPLVFLLLLVVAARAIKRGAMQGDPAWAFVGAFGLPLLVLLALVSPQMDLRPSWTAPAFLALSMGAGAWLTEKLGHTREAVRRRGRRLVGAGVCCCVGLVLLGYSVLRFGQPWFLGTNLVGGWRQLSAQVEQLRRGLRQAGHPEPFVLGMDRYSLAAVLGFYLQRPDLMVNTQLIGQPGLSSPTWAGRARWEGRAVVVVMPAGAERQFGLLQRHIDGLAAPRTVRLAAPSFRPRQYWLSTGQRFHFAMHPLPPAEASPAPATAQP